MQRRFFLKNGIAISAGMLLFPSLPQALTQRTTATLDELEKHFQFPPEAARPWVFYMWMNGNITKEGITLDLEAMQRMGIGGAICFNSAVGIPRGPVDYAGEAWHDATAHAAREAQRLGLQLSLHNSPGYSGCGGPWIPPELSMQQLVWTETQMAAQDGRVSQRLPRPYAKRGYYSDALVVAYPSLPAERGLMREQLLRVSVNGKPVDKDLLTDGSPETRLRLDAAGEIVVAGVNDAPFDPESPAASPGAPLALLFEFAQRFESRAISILRKAEVPRDLFDGDRDHPPVFQLEVSDDGRHFTAVGEVACSALREMDAPSTLSYPAVSGRFYRLSTHQPTWISNVELHGGPRLSGWQGKTNNTRASSAGVTPPIARELVIDPAQVRDISAYMNRDGVLDWTAPAGRWTILRIGHTTTGESPAAAPDAGKGLEVDKFSRPALDRHFSSFLDGLFTRLKPQLGHTLRAITVDSYEAGKQNWTSAFPAEFMARKYDLTSWMPAMTGRIVGCVDDTERFLWDVRKVQADLLAENFYGYYAQRCHQLGLEFYAEPYGDGNLDSLQIGSHLDITMSEFWTRYMYGSDTTSKQAASIAHAYGKPVVAAESFTAMPEHARWSDYPYSLKAEGDYFYSLGVNRLVFHTFVHQPYSTGLPGMTMGPFGMHIDRHNTWTGQAHAWTAYLTRSQYLLQQGLAVSDICYFKGDEPESGVPDIYQLLPYGYAGDVIGADVLQHRMRVEDDRIVLPDGMSYRVCVMAPLSAILPATLRRLALLVADGMLLVVGGKPSRAAGMADQDDVEALVAALYGPLNGVNVHEHRHHKGRVLWHQSLAHALDALGIAPDFQFSARRPDAAIHYLHKVVGDYEYYFICNHRRRAEHLTVSLRSAGRQPEIWNAETGQRHDAAIHATVDGRLVLPLELQPAGAVFVMLRRPAQGAATELLHNGLSLLMPAPRAASAVPSPAPYPYPDVHDDFTIALWAKPDTTARSGRSMLFHAPSGEAAYGKGHAACALSAGQNGVRLYESAGASSKEVLFAAMPLSGWTHIAVVYRTGTPTLYLQGRPVLTGKASGAVVHPGLDTPVQPAHYTTFFEGNQTAAVLERRALSDAAVLALFGQGLPAPAVPCHADLARLPDGRTRALVWQNGVYTLTGKGRVSVGACRERAVGGAWTVRFAAGSGAPAECSLPALASLKSHANPDIRHYAGTAVYLKSVAVSADDLVAERRIWLDLGRVEVVAELKVNGQLAAVLWKEPFMADITRHVHAGENRLEIAVTCLWQNRLIGDEQLPQEEEYSRHGYVKRLPAWYVRGQRKPGARKAFVVWKHVRASDPLLESGLLGPVRLLIPVETVF